MSTEKRSTGPCTPEGKAASSRNSFKHGLTANGLTGVPAEQLALLEAALIDQFQPQTAMESLLVHELAESQWRKDRTLAMEICALDHFPADAKSLALALRYRTQATNAFYKAHAELRRLQAERLAQQESLEAAEEFVSKSASKTPDPVTQLQKASLEYLKAALLKRPFDPAAHGYSCTVAEIEAFVKSETGKSVRPERLAA